MTETSEDPPITCDNCNVVIEDKTPYVSINYQIERCDWSIEVLDHEYLATLCMDCDPGREKLLVISAGVNGENPSENKQFVNTKKLDGQVVLTVPDFETERVAQFAEGDDEDNPLDHLDLSESEVLEDVRGNEDFSKGIFRCWPHPGPNTSAGRQFEIDSRATR